MKTRPKLETNTSKVYYPATHPRKTLMLNTQPP